MNNGQKDDSGHSSHRYFALDQDDGNLSMTRYGRHARRDRLIRGQDAELGIISVLFADARFLKRKFK